MRPCRPGVLCGTVDTEFSLVPLGRIAHRAGVERAGESVVDQDVDQRAVAVPVAAATPVEQVRRRGHRLHATGDHDVGLPESEHVARMSDRTHPGQAHLVDGLCGRPHAESGSYRGLPCGVLARTSLEHVTHQDPVDRSGVDPGPFHRSRDRGRPETHSPEARQTATETADRGARRTDDDDVVHHVLRSFSPALRPMSRCQAESVGRDERCLRRRYRSARPPSRVRGRPQGTSWT